MPNYIFSTWCEASAGDQPSAIGAAIEFGDDRQVIRPPIGVARSVAKVADGASSKLTEDDIDKIGKVGFPLKSARDGKFTAAVPVKVLTYFVPATRR